VIFNVQEGSHVSTDLDCRVWSVPEGSTGTGILCVEKDIFLGTETVLRTRGYLRVLWRN